MKRTTHVHRPALRAAALSLAIAVVSGLAAVPRAHAQAPAFEAFGANLLPARKRDKNYETDRWEAFGDLTNLDPEALLRDVDRGGATATILPASGTFPGDVEAWDAGECSPLGTNANPGPTIRCTNKYGSLLILRRATRAGGAQYVRATVRARHQLLVLPMPTEAETPLSFRLQTSTIDVVDTIGSCNFPSSGRVLCRDRIPKP